MLIKSIDIVGFKSFADKTTLKFGRGLTAVVGPNGSGKSNVSDAVRWVLGEQSTKSLRGNSMEDVIFSGTANRKPHGFCEVTIHFDNSDRSLNFNNDTVSVTRRYYRSHEGEYLINGAAVRLKDVHELFMDTGLGRDGYSMVGQGKVDAIVSSKSNERRDIFEEAAGISRYRYRKIDAERRLAAAEENLVRLRDIAEELKNRVGPLKQQSEKAECFLKLSQEKKNLEIGLWLYMLESSKEAFRQQESKIAVATGHYEQIEKQLAEYDRITEQNSADFAAATVAIDSLKGEISSLEESIARTEGEINVIRANIEHNTENEARLKSELEQLGLHGDDAKTRLEEKQGSILRLEEQKQSLVDEIQRVSDTLSGLIQSSESISKKIEEKALELNTLSVKISEKRVESVTAKSSQSEIASRLEAIDSAILLKNSETENYEKEMQQLNIDLNRCSEAVTSARNSLDGYKLRLQSRKSAAEQKKSKIEKLTLDISEKERRAKILEDLQKSMEGYQYSVKACMEQSKKGLLSGVRGPVSTLINVPVKYAVAVETALGAAAQNIVVNTDSDAKAAISFLKSGNKGRATFLPISAIRGRIFTETGLENCYGFVGMANELVKYDNEYKDIINWLLGRTVIAEDIDTAASIAKKYGYRFKVVSLDGQVVNPGGSLTGGSLSKNSGLLSRAGDIAELTEKAEKLKLECEELKKDYETSAAALAAVEADILAVQGECTTASEDKIRVEGEIRRVSQLLAAERLELESLKQEKRESTKRVEALNISAAETDKIITELEQKQQKLKSEMEIMNGGRDATSDERNKLTAQLTDLRLSAADVQKDIQSEKNAVEMLRQSSSELSDRAESIGVEISAAKTARSELEQKISALENSIVQMRQDISQKQSDVKAKIEQRTEIEGSSAALRQSEKEKTLERERINGELERLRAKKDSMTAELDDIVKKLYDEYELTRTEAEQLGIEIESPSDAKRALADKKAKIRALGSVNVAAIEEYKEVGQRYEFMSAQIADVEKTKTELNRLINELTTQMQQMFMEGFTRIGENFSRIFAEMFGGGHARLKLTDPNDVLQSGIDIVAKLPGKNVPSLEVLSGGEKALIAISIYFAIMQVNAPPFCFLDEVETALDDINVERFANYMKHSNLQTQFICITHRRGTMEAADMLYGVTMQEKGVTKLIELNVKQLEMDLKSLEQKN